FQHWLTAKNARSFKLPVVMHPVFIMIVWVPCVLIGAWATALPIPQSVAENANTVLPFLVKTQTAPLLGGLLTAGILAAIMSSLDSQFLCLGTIFTNDIVLHAAGKDKYDERQIVWIARLFIIGIVALVYILAMLAINGNVFDLAVWCFSGFAALTPIVIAALYWKRATKVGAYASIAAVVITWFIFFALSGFGGEYTIWGGIMPVAVCFTAGAIAMVVGSLLSKPPSDETIRKFFP
ncbi:MAG: sodium:solute symporter family protein, partial [Verrucomicrobiota bacterium]